MPNIFYHILFFIYIFLISKKMFLIYSTSVLMKKEKSQSAEPSGEKLITKNWVGNGIGLGESGDLRTGCWRRAPKLIKFKPLSFRNRFGLHFDCPTPHGVLLAS